MTFILRYPLEPIKVHNAALSDGRRLKITTEKEVIFYIKNQTLTDSAVS